MRRGSELGKLFIAIGCLIIAVLFTALLGPLFVDWTAYRDVFERTASGWIGQPVAVAGKADLRLLPTPVLSFTDVRVGAGEEPDLEVERFRAEVELAGLFKGEIRVIRMTLERPLFRFDIAGLDAARPDAQRRAWKVDPQQISLARLEILDGVALISDSRYGRSWQGERIDALVEAGSLRGPGRLEASLTLAGEPLSLRAAFGRIAADRSVSAKLTLASPKHPATLSADGTLFWPADASPRYEGAVVLAGAKPESGEQRSRWADFEAGGDFALSLAGLRIDDARLSYGAIERPLVLSGNGRVDFGEEPGFDVAVAARQIDLDRALGGEAEGARGVEAAFEAFLAALPDLPRVPLPGALHLDAQGVVIGGNVVQAVAVDLATTTDGWKVDALAAVLPGETRIELDGLLHLAGVAAFEGHGRLVSARPAALAAWWRGSSGSAAAIDRFAVEADLDLWPDEQRLSDLSVETDDGHIGGMIELRRFGEAREIFATVDLTAERADLVEARALAELLAGNHLGSGRVAQMTLSLSADALVAGGVEARGVALEGVVENGSVQVQRLSVADLAGAAIEARASLEQPFAAPSGRLEATVTADDISGAAAFLTGLLPDSPAIAELRRLAPALSPMQADISAEGGMTDAPLSLTLTGSFADTHVTLAAEGRGSLANPNSLSGNVKLHVDGEDSAAVLTQLGLEPVPIRAGPFTLDAGFSGMLASAGSLDVKGNIAGVRVTYEAETAVEGGRIALVGNAQAESLDIDPALLLAGLALPGLGEGHAAAARGRLEIDSGGIRLELDEASHDGRRVEGGLQAKFGDPFALSGALEVESLSLPMLAGLLVGNAPAMGESGWSDAAFASALPPATSVDLRLKAKMLDLGVADAAGDAELALKLSDDSLNINLAKARFAGGSASGTLVASLADGAADASLRASLEGAKLDALVWRSGELPLATGLLDLSFELAGGGRSIAGLVSTLAGSGSFAIADGRLNRFNPRALDAVMQAAEGDKEPDEEKAREAFATTFGVDSLAFDNAAGSFSVAAGSMQVPPVSVRADAGTVLAEATLDLNTLDLSSTWTIRAAGSPSTGTPPPSARVFFEGPIAAPDRRVDLNPLLDAVRTRYLQRQLDKLEALEAERVRREAVLQALSRQMAEEKRKQRVRTTLAPPGAAPHSARPSPAAGAAAASGRTEPPGRTVAPAADEAQAAPPAEPQTQTAAPAADLVRRIAPAVRDVVSGAQTNTP